MPSGAGEAESGPWPRMKIADTAGMKTFEEVFRERHRCSAMEFRRRVFWHSLHPHAVPLAPLFLVSAHFTPERALISGCAQARSMRALLEELDSYLRDPANGHWLRRRCGLRLSTRRLRKLAKDYLPGAGLPPPFALEDGGRSRP